MIDISKFTPAFFQLAKSGRAVKLLYNKEPVQVCTSTLTSPFGVKSNEKEWSNFTEYSIDCSVNNVNSESATTFKTFLETLDVEMEKLLRKNIGMFPNVNISDDSEIAYSPIYKGNGDYPKLIKLQLPRDKLGNFESFIFDSSKNKIKLTDDNIAEILAKRKYFKCIIECSKVWHYNGRIGSIWNIVQLRFSDKPPVAPLGGSTSGTGTTATTGSTDGHPYNSMLIMD
jgi:hypothetical protein